MYPHPARIYGDIIPGSEFIRSLVCQGTISKGAAKRLKWFDYYRGCGNARQTCRYFGISAQTFNLWKNRFDPYDLTTLEEESRRRHGLAVRGRVKRWWREFVSFGNTTLLFELPLSSPERPRYPI